MAMLSRLQRARVSRLRDRSGSSSPTCEALEGRVVLANSPFPDIGLMVNPNNTVVRFEFQYGGQVHDVDLELFDKSGPNGSPAPTVTVRNFLNYVRSGRYDNSFLHRSADDATFPIDFVVQGGGFTWTDAGGLKEIEEDAAITNEFHAGRSNIEKTIAMAQRGGNPNSATSQFYFNMVDNTFLNNQRFVVFGRVITQAHWDVIEEIADLPVFDFSDLTGTRGQPGRQPLPNANETSFALDEVPVTANPPPASPPNHLPSSRLRESLLVNIVNIEVVKALDDRAFMTSELLFPEGYRNTTSITETLHLVNTAPNNSAAYQVIARYAADGRDVVIAHGTLAGNEHKQVRVSNFTNQNLDIVRKGKPYGLVVQSSRAVAATLTHSDFGATASEAFINPAELRELGSTVLRTWDFGGPGVVSENPVDPNIVRRPFVLFMNTTPFAATVSVTFARPNGNALTVQRVVGPYRRAGVDVAATLGANVISSIRVTSNRDIVASLTVYEDRGAAPEGANAYMTAGVPGGGRQKGALSFARFEPTRETYITAVNANPAAAVVWLTFVRTDGTQIDRRWDIPASRRATFNVRDSGIPANTPFSVIYSSSQAVSMQYVTVLGSEVTSTPFTTTGSTVLGLANGGLRLSATNMTETISVFNPYRSADIEVRLVVSFQFSGSSNNRIDLPTTSFVLRNWQRADINPRDFNSIVSKIGAGPAFENYSVVIRAVGKRLSTQQTFNAAVVAELARWRPGNSRAAIMTQATPNNDTFFLDHSQYNR